MRLVCWRPRQWWVRCVQTTTNSWPPPRSASVTVGTRPRDARTVHCPRDTGNAVLGVNTPTFIKEESFIFTLCRQHDRSAGQPPRAWAPVCPLVAVSARSHFTYRRSQEEKVWLPGPDPAWTRQDRSPRYQEQDRRRDGKAGRPRDLPTQDPLISSRWTFACSYTQRARWSLAKGRNAQTQP